ncbi:eukaryotic translation initiation factor 2-alpha kinase 1 isoform X2 [Lampris incognitus]|uniref:eukaryotic translation initiation factor 2-alpha kinase 1 isoform X2 n=1 Tax=Lampris incognitus TaxID=2546036 RepID=UPI0024B4D04F|nr:eukaryotic translation initiation factor 2-alpha kinase 1 isoform X2 [Lampris incognitus]
MFAPGFGSGEGSSGGGGSGSGSNSNVNHLLVKRGGLTTVSKYGANVFTMTTEEDDEEAQFDTSDSDNFELRAAGESYPSIQEFASAIPNHLLLGSLLEHLCFVYESDPTRSRMLFKVIGQHLAAMNLLSPLAISDEFSTVRLQHNRAFTELLHAARSSVLPQGPQLLNADAQSLTVRPKEGLFQAQTSRYLSEFVEICRLGKGSYGSVFKVINKLDGQSYAVKKILIKKVSTEDCMKVLREAKVLSGLQHVNVVGYHTAWMEHVQPAANSHSCPPALESPARQNSDDSADCCSSGSSVVFQSTGPVKPDVPPVKALVPSLDRSQVVCPKTMRSVPEHYVPCVFLGQRGSVKMPPCPAINWDMLAILEKDSGVRKLELNNNSSVDMGAQQRTDKCTTKPSKEVHFQLMLYIQMQLCERSLKDWLTERNARPREEPGSRCPYGIVEAEVTLNLLRNILEGVEYIHSKGIMHRDLKPRNIFLHGRDCHVRIGDFGLACGDIIVDDHEPLLSTSFNAGSTHTTGVGTFVYAAPEQLEGSHYDSKSDMYSIGVLALELFQPFGTEMERVRTLGDLRDGKIPGSFCCRWTVLAEHIMKLTSKDPSMRPSATQLLESQLFNSKDMVIHGLQRRVEEQEEEILQLRRQISQLQSSEK